MVYRGAMTRIRRPGLRALLQEPHIAWVSKYADALYEDPFTARLKWFVATDCIHPVSYAS